MPNKPDLAADINFLYEMGNVRHIQRMWQRFNSPQLANLTEHHFRVFWIAMAIAAHEEGVDTGKLAKLAMQHDISESRTGDVDILSRQYVERNEELAITDMLAGTSLETEVLELWHEYEDRETIESKIIKDADNLDVDFELAELAASGSTLPANKAEIRTFVSENKLYTQTAKDMFAQLKNSNPHDWWQKSRTRRNSGDWQTPVEAKTTDVLN